MLIPPNPASISTVRAPEPLPATGAGTAAQSSVMDWLHNLILADRLQEKLDAGTFSIDKALEKFWEGMIDDCAYRTGPELARHNYHRDLGQLEQRGGQLMREVMEMPAGPARSDAEKKLGNFLSRQRAQIEARFLNDSLHQPWAKKGSHVQPSVRMRIADL